MLAKEHVLNEEAMFTAIEESIKGMEVNCKLQLTSIHVYLIRFPFYLRCYTKTFLNFWPMD